MDPKRDAANLTSSDLLPQFFESWRLECFARFEAASSADVDALIACRIRLQAIEEFKYHVAEQLAKLADSDKRNASASAHAEQ